MEAPQPEEKQPESGTQTLASIEKAIVDKLQDIREDDDDYDAGPVFQFALCGILEMIAMCHGSPAWNFMRIAARAGETTLKLFDVPIETLRMPRPSSVGHKIYRVDKLRPRGKIRRMPASERKVFVWEFHVLETSTSRADQRLLALGGVVVFDELGNVINFLSHTRPLNSGLIVAHDEDTKALLPGFVEDLAEKICALHESNDARLEVKAKLPDALDEPLFTHAMVRPGKPKLSGVPYGYISILCSGTTEEHGHLCGLMCNMDFYTCEVGSCTQEEAEQCCDLRSDITKAPFKVLAKPAAAAARKRRPTSAASGNKRQKLSNGK